MQGGAIYYNLKRPHIIGSRFQDNSAQYGQDLASYPVKVKIKDQPNDDLKFSNIGSGVAMSSPVMLALMDYDDQVVNLNNQDQIGIFASPGSKSTVKGTNSFPFQFWTCNYGRDHICQ